MSRDNAFFDTLDMAGNLQRAIRGLSGLGGVEALGLAIGLLLFDVPIGALCWHFDVRPTIVATSAIAVSILASLPGAGGLPPDADQATQQIASYIAIIGQLLTLLPTLAEFTMPRLAAAGFRVAGIMVYSLAIFDAFTDWQPVKVIMDGARAGFDSFGLLALPVWWLARLILLFMATIGFEMIFVITLVCALHLLWQSRSSRNNQGAMI